MKGLSRNKVSLAEAGDGSPPFYLKNRAHKAFISRKSSLNEE